MSGYGGEKTVSNGPLLILLSTTWTCLSFNRRVYTIESIDARQTYYTLLFRTKSIEKSILDRHCMLVRSWKVRCTLTSIFTLLPVDLEENVYLILVGSVVVLVSAILAVILLPRYIQATLPTNQTK